MKSCATGLSVRCFNVMIATALRVVGKSMGRRLSAALLAGKVKTDWGAIVRNRAVESRALRTGVLEVMIVVRGTASPLEWKASWTTEPVRLSGGGSVQG